MIKSIGARNNGLARSKRTYLLDNYQTLRIALCHRLSNSLERKPGYDILPLVRDLAMNLGDKKTARMA